MKRRRKPNETTGLLRGDASKIARIHRVSRTHVEQVAAGERQGRANLLDTIRRYQEQAKLAQEAA